MIYLRDRYFYANISKPTYPLVLIGGIQHWNIGSITIEGDTTGYTIDPMVIDDSVGVIEIVDNLICIPVTIGDGQDGYAQVSVRYKRTTDLEWSTLTASIRTFPLANFLVSCTEQPDGVDVWAIDLDSNCEFEALNGNAIDVSITDILFTSEGERPRHIKYGSPIPGFIWSNITNALAENLLDKTIEALARFERRIFIDRGRATMTIDKSKHSVILTIPYSVRENQKKYLYRKKFSTL